MDPPSGALRLAHAGTQRNLAEAVGKIHQGYLDFRPTAEVRTFREVAAHLLNTRNEVCAALRGGAAPPVRNLEKTHLSRDQFLAAGKQSIVYCQPAMQALTDAGLGTLVKMGSRELTPARIAQSIVSHGAQHYDNLVTYLRLRGTVPPETERAQLKATPAKPGMAAYYMRFLKLNDSDIRGILGYKTRDIEEAKRWANADPAVVASRLVLVIHPWMSQEGYLP